MIIVCHNCSSRYKIKNELVASGSKRTKCRKCGAIMLIMPLPEGADSDSVVETADGKQAPAAEKEPSAAPAVEKEPAAEPPPAEPSQKQPPVAEKAPADEAPPAAEEDPSAVPAPGESGPEKPPGQPEKKEEESEDPLVKLEKRRQQMEDEISGRLNKAALETLSLSELDELSARIKNINENPNYEKEPDTQLFACIGCKSVYSLFPEDPRTCNICSGDQALVKADDILKQHALFRRK
ncbi:MAG: zinc-ribbon domain-containing protein [Gemmatimonadota bacterium]|nr:zinc-ribbon domain-containing protein [Gemmatimonadota bacterium]